MGLDTIVEISHEYGSNPEYVLAGGGNTSFKTNELLYIKGSGTSLSTIVENGFVKMSRIKLDNIYNKVYPADKDVRERDVLKDMMDARCPGEETKRPSVETLLHNLFSQTYILHVHPAMVNGITCSVNGEKLVNKLFPYSIWVEETEPGYVLASKCKKLISDYENNHKDKAKLLFLQNHGIFFAADTKEEIESLCDEVMTKISSLCKIAPDMTDITYDNSKIDSITNQIKDAYPRNDVYVTFELNREVYSRCKSKESFEPLTHALTPDHIVYCKAVPLFIEEDEIKTLSSVFEGFKTEHGFLPKVIFLKNVGMFAVGNNEKDAKTVVKVWNDALKIHRYTDNFGGLRAMAPSMVDFIVNWEVESYRSKVAEKS